jgi:hypothetical protein
MAPVGALWDPLNIMYHKAMKNTSDKCHMGGG